MLPTTPFNPPAPTGALPRQQAVSFPGGAPLPQPAPAGATEVSQSLIKTLEDPFHCPFQVRTHYVERTHARTPSAAMVKGQLFEYLALETLPREGGVPRLAPVRVSGRFPQGFPSVDEERIRRQAARFHEVLEQEGIAVTERNVPIALDYDRHSRLTGIIDFRGRIHGQPAVFDLKLTQDLRSEWGYYAFGDFELVDKIQAHAYLYMEQQRLGVAGLPFYYLVFDYKPQPEYRLLGPVTLDAFAEMNLHRRIHGAATQLQAYARQGYPRRPSRDACRGCGHRQECPQVYVKPEYVKPEKAETT